MNSIYCILSFSFSFFDSSLFFFFFFFNDTATTEIYTLSLHDALPISKGWPAGRRSHNFLNSRRIFRAARIQKIRSEEHTSELQSLTNLVCRLLLEKKKKKKKKKMKPQKKKIKKLNKENE